MIRKPTSLARVSRRIYGAVLVITVFILLVLTLPCAHISEILLSPHIRSPHYDTVNQEAALLAMLNSVGERRVPNPTVSEILQNLSDFHFELPAGQVGLETPYGKVLYDLTILPDVRVAIETGTWDGSGSSMALGMGFKDTEGILLTIEAVEEKWIHAQHNLAPYPVKCLLGVGVDSSELPTVQDVLQSGGVSSHPPDEWIEWLAGEKTLSNSYPVGLIRPICERFKVDLVHIDGGEFAGPSEFRAVLKHCVHIRYIALDDTRMYKNKGNYQFLASDAGWEVVREDPNDRHGWAVFRRRTVN